MFIPREPASSGGATPSAEPKRVDAKAAPAEQRGRKQCKVVAIAEKVGSSRVVVCTLHPSDKARQDGMILESDTRLKAMPTDKRMPWFVIQINDVTKRALNIPGRLDKYQLWPCQKLRWDENSS